MEKWEGRKERKKRRSQKWMFVLYVYWQVTLYEVICQECDCM